MNTQQLLKQRGKTHGDFEDNARIAQALKSTVRQEEGWQDLDDVNREAIEMILHKIARWVSAPKIHPDNAEDVAGYAKLTLND